MFRNHHKYIARKHNYCYRFPIYEEDCKILDGPPCQILSFFVSQEIFGKGLAAFQDYFLFLIKAYQIGGALIYASIVG